MARGRSREWGYQDDEEFDDEEEVLVCGSIQDYVKRENRPIFWCPPLSLTRFIYPLWWPCIWVFPMLLAGCGFILQNWQLRIGTYYYVHQMVQHDLLQVQTNTSNINFSVAPIPMTFGKTPNNVSFGALHDVGSKLVGAYEKVNLKFLDMLAAIFPILFCFLAIALDNSLVWTKIMLIFFLLAVGKGMFSWMTVVPDSSGWQVCRDRLAGSQYSAEWYAGEHSEWSLLFMNPTSRLCADMMYSGHTYFVTLFAFGLHELTRSALRTSPATTRIFCESLVAVAAIVQQIIEVYFVIKSRFHYTSDVVMAVVITYLLYTNTSVSLLASAWVRPKTLKTLKEVLRRAEALSGERHQYSSAWIDAFRPRAQISLGCCCWSASTQYIYSRGEIWKIIGTIKKAQDNPGEYEMTPQIRMRIREESDMLAPRSVGCWDSSSSYDDSDLDQESSLCDDA